MTITLDTLIGATFLIVMRLTSLRDPAPQPPPAGGLAGHVKEPLNVS